MAGDNFLEEAHTQMLQEAHAGRFNIESYEEGYIKGLATSGRYLVYCKMHHPEGCDCANCEFVRGLAETEKGGAN